MTKVLEHLRAAQAHLNAAVIIARADQESCARFMEHTLGNLNAVIRSQEQDEARMKKGSYR